MFVLYRMKKQIFCIALLVIAAVNVFAQTGKTVDKINKTYNDIAEKARLCETDDDQGEFGGLVMNTLTINSRNHQWRAVGIYGQTLKFFYKGGDTEERLYPDKLVFVVNERRVSNQRFREEWLFSENGTLMLFTYKVESDESPSEARIYYSAGRAIRTLDGKKVTDRLSALDLKYTKERAVQGGRIKALFARSIDL